MGKSPADMVEFPAMLDYRMVIFEKLRSFAAGLTY